ncbi:MAG: HTH-type transcriptional repressor of NAD biosynthesis genes [Saprospiraceae bacterium]|jgi:HTH-type transcriptional repressor of NAD biosynthesis genes
MEKRSRQAPSSCLKIVLFGPESSGKTTLTKQLATYFNTLWLPEYMRTYLEHKWRNSQETIAKEDLLPIAEGQIVSENKISSVLDTVLFLDTNVLQIKTYCEYYYDGWCPPEIAEAALIHKYDYYFLTDIDTPWVPDNLRDRPYDREKMFRIFEKQLVQNKIPFTLLKGSKEKRLAKAISIIKTLTKQK